MNNNTGANGIDLINKGKSKTKLYFLGIIILFALHFLVAISKIPPTVQAYNDIYITAGFATGIFLIFAIIFPVIVTLLSLLFPMYRNVLTAVKMFLGSLCIALLLNFLFVYVLFGRYKEFDPIKFN
jgi:hypothetical protein